MNRSVPQKAPTFAFFGELRAGKAKLRVSVRNQYILCRSDLSPNLERDSNSGLGFVAVVDFATSDFETCPKFPNWVNFIDKSTTES